MTKQKHEARLRLRDVANTLSEEVWEGEWDHLLEIRTKPIAASSTRFPIPIFSSNRPHWPRPTPRQRNVPRACRCATLHGESRWACSWGEYISCG